jgi:response regulator RpfG family c-di-GMP phosphodiesterase
MHPTGNLRLLDKLVASGLISTEQRESALNSVNSFGERVEEVLLDMNAIEEVALLKFIAGEHKTRFISTEKLAKAGIDRTTLDHIPHKLAEQRTVFPVMYEANTQTLSVVSPDPDDLGVLQEIQLVAGVKNVRAFVGRPRAVKAAIAKAYGGDIHAFGSLDRAAHEQFTTMLNVYERNLVSEETMTDSLARDAVGRERVLSTEELDTSRGDNEFLVAKGVSLDSYTETLNVLVSLVENGRPDLRGHSAHVARLCRKLGERIGLSELQKTSLVIAAYVHDLGKMGTYHLTALNVAQYEAHRASATKLSTAPLRLVESVRLPRDTEAIVANMYERFDGGGIPEGARAKDIPLGARILAIADTYADLTQNPRNPFRQILGPAKSCEVLKKYAGAIFDPNLVDLFRIVMTGEDLKARLLATRYLVLLVDPDPEETTVLELRLVEQGFEVRQAHTAEQALKALSSGDFELVVSEIELEQGDGLSLIAEVRKQSWGRNLPWIFVTSRTGRGDAQRAFELGASDYLNKPVAAELFVTKAKQILERQAGSKGNRGVSGSLAEMGLPEIVQILWHGRKLGRLKVRSGPDSGEIHFVGGAIYNALWATLRGEEAFYAMLGLQDGEFVLEPGFEAPQRVITLSPEGLLLEGMRRFDEANR